MGDFKHTMLIVRRSSCVLFLWLFKYENFQKSLGSSTTIYFAINLLFRYYGVCVFVTANVRIPEIEMTVAFRIFQCREPILHMRACASRKLDKFPSQSCEYLHVTLYHESTFLKSIILINISRQVGLVIIFFITPLVI